MMRELEDSASMAMTIESNDAVEERQIGRASCRERV